MAQTWHVPAEPAAEWWTPWRPAPAHLVDDWRVMSAAGKSAVMKARDILENGGTQAYLSTCCLGDPGAALVSEVLQNCVRLRSINLKHNQIGDKGAVQLCDAMESISGLQSLCLSANWIGDVGAARVAHVVEKHPELRLTSLDSNRIGDFGARKLLAALSKNPRPVEVVLANNPVKRLRPRALESLAPVAEAVERLSQVGVTLLTLLQIYTDGVADGTIKPRQTTTGEVVQKLLLPASRRALKSYSEAVTPNNPPPMTQVIHAWDALFEDLVRAVARHAMWNKEKEEHPPRDAEVLDPNHYTWKLSPEWTGKSYFLDAFCVNQHWHVDVRAHRELSRFADHPRVELGDPLCQVDRLDLVAHRIIDRGGRLLMVVDTANLSLSRIHCLHELHQALCDRLPVDVIFGSVRVLPKDQRTELVQRSEASITETREQILEWIEDGPGGFEAFNQAILQFVDDHVDREFSAVLDQFDSKAY